MGFFRSFKREASWETFWKGLGALAGVLGVPAMMTTAIAWWQTNRGTAVPIETLVFIFGVGLVAVLFSVAVPWFLWRRNERSHKREVSSSEKISPARADSEQAGQATEVRSGDLIVHAADYGIGDNESEHEDATSEIRDWVDNGRIDRVVLNEAVGLIRFPNCDPFPNVRKRLRVFYSVVVSPVKVQERDRLTLPTSSGLAPIPIYVGQINPSIGALTTENWLGFSLTVFNGTGCELASDGNLLGFITCDGAKLKIPPGLPKFSKMN